MVLLAALGQLLPPQALIYEPAERAAYEQDWRGLFNNPALCVVCPNSAAQIAAIIQICREAGVKLVPQGGNTGLVAGGVPTANSPQVILSLRRMNKIRSVDPVSDTIIVEAGVTLKAVQDSAVEIGRLFPVSLGAEGTAQIGGVIATNAGGMQVLSYGNMRAQVLGLEVVLADGRIWHGLKTLRKDNTGFDLKQVFIGSEGMLGIITAAALRLQPGIAARQSALVGVASVEAALDLFQALRGKSAGLLTLCEFIDGPAMQLGAAYAPAQKLPFAAPSYVLAELSSPSDSYDLTSLLELVLTEALERGAAVDAVIAQSERERADFLALREAVPEGELREGGALKHDIAVPVAAMPGMVNAVKDLIAASYPTCRPNIFGHIGDGNLHINIRPPEEQHVADMSDYKARLTAEIEALAMLRGGSFSAEHGIGQIKLDGMLAHKSPIELDLMRAIKHALDPEDLLNPGKMLPTGGVARGY